MPGKSGVSPYGTEHHQSGHKGNIQQKILSESAEI